MSTTKITVYVDDDPTKSFVIVSQGYYDRRLGRQVDLSNRYDGIVLEHVVTDANKIIEAAQRLLK